MELTVELPPEIESAILAEAEHSGLQPPDFLKRIILEARARPALQLVLHEFAGSLVGLEALTGAARSGEAELLAWLSAELRLFRHKIANFATSLADHDRFLSPSTFNIPELLQECVNLFAWRARQQEVSFHLEIPPQPLDLRSDRSSIAQLLIALLDNAVKYSLPDSAGRGSTVRVEARRRDIGNRIEVNVTSYGIGILPDELASGAIFEDGRRGRLAVAAGRAVAASGRGLAQARQIAATLGGRIRVTSTPLHDDVYRTSATLILPQIAEIP